MDGNQTERKSISLTKEPDNERSHVREAYPVYSRNESESTLERREYRNVPEHDRYQQPRQEYGRPGFADDPLPAQNRYASPEPQYQQGNAFGEQSDDLGRYYNYETPDIGLPVREMPPAAPQVNQPPVPQQATKFCKYCGKKIAADAVACVHCGRQIENINRGNQAPVHQTIYNQQFFDAVSDKDKSTALILACLGFIGAGGIHRFYAGKPLSGLLYLVTGGLCGFGTLVDIIMIASGTFKDGNGRIIKK